MKDAESFKCDVSNKYTCWDVYKNEGEPVIVKVLMESGIQMGNMNRYVGYRSTYMTILEEITSEDE